MTPTVRPLTDRQMEALRLSCRHSNAEIGERLGVSEQQIKRLLSAAYGKLEAQGFHIGKQNKRSWFCYLLGLRECIDRIGAE